MNESIEWYVNQYANNCTAQEKLDKDLEKFQTSWAKTRNKSYFKVKVPQSDNLYLMFWAPNGYTRPHEHLYPDGYTGVPATIYVLRGRLVQQHYILYAVGYDLLSESDYWVGGEPMEEDAQVLHRIVNPSLKDWAVSIHEFVPGFKMRVYEFALNKKWIVSGRRDTLGRPSDDAKPIWPR